VAQHAFGIDAMALVRREREPITEQWATELERSALRRLAGEPVSRIVGEREFWGLRFGINSATLDPRPETEMLVADAIAAAETKPSPRIVDLGTGSGAIAVAIADALPKARLVATDISPEALSQARANAERHRVASTSSICSRPYPRSTGSSARQTARRFCVRPRLRCAPCWASRSR
jgi:release factor glutamine methyltransferase